MMLMIVIMIVTMLFSVSGSAQSRGAESDNDEDNCDDFDGYPNDNDDVLSERKCTIPGCGTRSCHFNSQSRTRHKRATGSNFLRFISVFFQIIFVHFLKFIIGIFSKL